MRTSRSRITNSFATHSTSADRRRGPSLVVLAAVCWGTGGLAGTILGSQSGLSPLAVGSYRLLVAAAILVAAQSLDRHGVLAGTIRALVASRSDGLKVLGVGLGLALFQLCYFVAVGTLGVSVATLLTLGLAPVLVTLTARVLLGERGDPRLRVAMPVALLGLLLLVGLAGAAVGDPDGTGSPSRGNHLLGVVAACTSAAGYAGVTLLGRSLSVRVQSAHVTTVSFVVAALAALPAGAVAGMGFGPGLVSLSLVVYLGVVPTALAYGLFFAGLRGTTSSTAAVLTLVEPLTATLLAVLLLGERLSTVQWVGGVLLMTAVVVLSAPAGRNAPAQAGSAQG